MAQVKKRIKQPDQLAGVPTTVQSLTLQFDQLAGQQLAAVPWQELTRLTNLQSLDFFQCTTLQELPADIISTLTNLQSLCVEGCHTLRQLPAGIGSLTKLQSLDVSRCGALQELPAELGSLDSLQDLRVSRCAALKQLPLDISSLHKLQYLEVKWCDSLQALPDISSLASLTSLTVEGWETLQELPPGISSLDSLRSLIVSHCGGLQELMAQIGSLSNLQALGVGRCDALQALPPAIGSLTSLTSLRVDEWNTLQELPPEISGLNSLQSLRVKDCGALQELPASISSLTDLQSLRIKGCGVFQSWPTGVSRLTKLTLLDVSFSAPGGPLQGLPAQVGSLTNLQSLSLQRWAFLQQLPTDISRLVNLQHVSVHGCEALQALPASFGKLTALTALDLAYCTSLELLPDSCDQLKALQELSWWDCPAFGRAACLLAALSWLYEKLPRSGSSSPWCCCLSCGVACIWTMQLCSECLCPTDMEARQHWTAHRGYQTVYTVVKQQRRRQTQQATIKKLATQQDVMLTSLERMSWLVVLLATATFIAYLQPPGGLDSQHVLVSNVTSCSEPSPELLAGGMSGFMQCAMLLFFVFDGLSFGLSVGCLVLIVMLSMPRIQWQEEHAEAGRFYVLLLLTWLLLYLAVSFGFAAFIASGLSVHAQPWMVLGPVIPGMVLLLAGAVFFLHRFHTLNPGCAAVLAALPFRERQLAPVESDIELGQARFWREWPQYLSQLPRSTANAAAAAHAQPAAAPGSQASADVVGEGTPLLRGQQAGPGSSSRLPPQPLPDAAAASP